MYDRSLFLKLNNYGYSDENIEEVKDYIVNLKLPDKKDIQMQKQKDTMKSGVSLRLETINYFIKN